MKTYATRALLLLTVTTALACAEHEPGFTGEGAPMWDRCHSAFERYCREAGQGAANAERDCRRDWRARYAAAQDDVSRRRVVQSIGCGVM